jgi:hypothetical protein
MQRQDVFLFFTVSRPGIILLQRRHIMLMHNKNTVTDLINALPGNGSVNTAQHATIEQRGYATRF